MSGSTNVPDVQRVANLARGGRDCTIYFLSGPGCPCLSDLYLIRGLAIDWQFFKYPEQQNKTAARGEIWDRKNTFQSDSSAPAPKMQLNRSRRTYDIVMVLFACGLLFLTALPIDVNDVSALETRAFRLLNDLPEGLYRPLWVVMQLGNLVVVPIAALVALVLRRVRLASSLTAAGLLVWWLAKVVKEFVPRGRPAELLTDVVLRDAPAAGNGYISGHAAVAFALVAVAAPHMKRRFTGLALVLATFVCLARVYVGAHLPLDVIGGAAFGLMIGSLVNLVMGIPADRR